MACREAKLAKASHSCGGRGFDPRLDTNQSTWQRPRLQIFHILMIFTVRCIIFHFVKQASRDGSPVFVVNSKIKDMTFEEFKTQTIIKANELIMANDLEMQNLAMLNTAAKNAKFDILSWIKNRIKMTITEKEIIDDFDRFIRHEAMRANTTQDEIRNVLIRKSIDKNKMDIKRVLCMI